MLRTFKISIYYLSTFRVSLTRPFIPLPAERNHSLILTLQTYGGCVLFSKFFLKFFSIIFKILVFTGLRKDYKYSRFLQLSFCIS